jgi:hypothetical protein
LDALYAWHKQDLPVHVPDCDYHHYCEVGDDETINTVTGYKLQVAGKASTGYRALELETWNLELLLLIRDVYFFCK